ncbi:MAG: GNAT family N-acetyltransferase [Alphaproteobacteria bacterium]|nr:GNAT family N-acetyltransferase [Alphaproteobacteria bacterium]MCA0450722.1 GNAT family N-acetyltransferase [Pseudomonadota bacterium]
MKIRPATAADFAAIAGIAERAYRQGFGKIMTPTGLALRDAAHFAERFARESIPPILAETDDGTTLGFHLTQDGTLRMLFVDPGVQSQGAGGALLADAEARGAECLECFRDNKAARAFYEKRGWVHSRDYDREFIGDVYAFVEYVKPAGWSVIGGE